ADYQYRVRFVAIRSLVIQIPAIAMGWVYWLALRPEFGGEMAGIRWISIALSLGILVCGFTPAILFKERFTAKPRSSERLFKAVGQAVQNRPFVMILGMRALVAIYGVYQGLIFYINTYFVCNGDKGLATKIWGLTEIAGFVLGFIVAPLALPISNRFGKRALLFIALGAHLLLGALAPFLYIPSHPYLQIASTLLLTPAGILFGTFCGASIPDVCDLDELEHGTRREGLFGSSMVFIQKVEAALYTLAVGYILASSGFAIALVKQSAGTLLALRIYAFVPYIIASSGALFIALRYPLTGEIMRNVRVMLLKKREAEVPSV
ncbi:MAG: MFS transporter, partial [Casimicrobiaceae bacterium]